MFAQVFHHFVADPATSIYLLQAVTYAVAAKFASAHGGRPLALIYIISSLLHGTLCACHIASAGA